MKRVCWFGLEIARERRGNADHHDIGLAEPRQVRGRAQLARCDERRDARALDMLDIAAAGFERFDLVRGEIEGEDGALRLAERLRER